MYRGTTPHLSTDGEQDSLVMKTLQRRLVEEIAETVPSSSKERVVFSSLTTLGGATEFSETSARMAVTIWIA